MNDAATPATPAADAGPDPEPLVSSWLPIPDVAQRCGVALSVVRRWLDDRELLAWRVGERRILCVPAGFLGDDGPLHSLRGTLTVLADAGLSDGEALVWLHTADATLPGADTPIAALRDGHRTEIRRRAMELAL